MAAVRLINTLLQNLSLFRISVIAMLFLTLPTLALRNANSIQGSQWMVKIIPHSTPNEHAVCSGVQIEERTVLTAAHCILHPGKKIPVYFFINQSEQRMVMGMPTIHPKYSGSNEVMIGLHKVGLFTTSYDLAIISLDEPVNNPALSSLLIDANLKIKSDSSIVLMGYGAKSLGRPSEQAQSVLLTTGKFEMRKQNSFVGGSTKLLVQSSSGACEGDSGGPIYLLQDGKKYLLGVHIFGDCGGFTEAEYIPGSLNWIHQLMGQ